MFGRPPVEPPASGTQDGGVMRRNVHPARGRRSRYEALAQRTSRAIPPLCAIEPSRACRIARRQTLSGRAADDVVTDVVLEPLDWKAAGVPAPHRFAMRDDIVNLAVFQRGIDPTAPLGGVGGDLPDRTPQGLFDGVQPLVEAAGIVLFAGDGLDVDDDAFLIVDRGVLLVARP